MTLLALLSLGIWLVLLLARGSFWRIEPDLLPSNLWPRRLPSVLAIVPARDEAETIGRTLPALLAQNYRGSFEVLLVNDASTDGTGEIARRLAALSPRLTVLDGATLPGGWTGKLHAMHQGVLYAERRETAPDLLLFADADILHPPDSLSRLVMQREATGAVLVSLMVRLALESLAERLLVPAFVFFFRMLYPFRWVRDPAKRCAAAAGGVMLVDRMALQAAGGLPAIRDALIDDCALGALMKRQGPVWLGLTADVLSIRAYPRFDDIRRMVARSAYAELRYSPLRLAVALFGLALVFVLPPLALVISEGPARIAGLLAYAAMMAAFAPMVRFYRSDAWNVPLLPVIAASYGLFTLDSAFQHWRGRGGAWKGRLQARKEGPARS